MARAAPYRAIDGSMHSPQCERHLASGIPPVPIAGISMKRRWMPGHWQIGGRSMAERRSTRRLSTARSAIRQGARDVLLQCVHFAFLLFDLVLNEFADAEYTDQALVLDHRQVTDVVGRHQGQAMIQAVALADGHHVGAHDLGDRRIDRGLALKHDLPRVITFRHDADQAVVVSKHDQRTAVLFGHQLQRVDNRGLLLDTPDVATLFVEKLPDAVHEHDLADEWVVWTVRLIR